MDNAPKRRQDDKLEEIRHPGPPDWSEGAPPATLVPKWAGEFSSHQHWINKAQSWLQSPSYRPAICVDAKGRRCAIGADFMRARDESAFPVRYFWECEPVAQISKFEALAGAVEWPADLHHDTARLVVHFAAAMARKLAAAEQKYGYTNGWKDKGWMDQCRAQLLEHLAKGDPRDVANYCAFLWWNVEKTAAPAAPASADNPSTAGVAELTKERITEVGLRLRIQAFENANYRFVQGSKMTEPEQDEFNQQVEFARAIWRLAAPVAQSTAGAAKDTPESMANSNARFAIDGAIQYGRENRNQPPSTDHWLYEYWNIGRQLNEAGRTGWDNVTPLAAPALNPSEVPHWISVEDRLPAAENEDTGRDAMVSDSLFIRGVAIDGGEAIGLGDYSPDAHVPDAGWRCYGGDYDFMHFAKVTHWMKPGRPAAPEHSALRTASKEGGAA